jgi:hypothetical protein
MGKEYTHISERLQRWIERQKVFFVATAPLSGDGLVNCSPKGLDTFRVLGASEVAYLDLGGSGIETVAHLKENSRITLMMCAFEGPPKIYRFYGSGTVVEPHDAEFPDLLQMFPEQPTARNIIRIDVDRIIDSCGFGVPLYDYKADRESLSNYYNKQSADDILEYRKNRNSESLDGLPGLEQKKK